MVAATPTPGNAEKPLAAIYGGVMAEAVQLYRWVRRRVFVNRWGVERLTIDWLTNCPDCGIEFEVFTDAQFTKPVRRCAACKHEGMRVGLKPVPVWPDGGGGGAAEPAAAREPEASSAKTDTQNVRIPDTSAPDETEQNQ